MLLRLSGSFLDLLLQFRHFTASSQKIAAVFISSAADGASGHEQLALQSHHSHGMPIFLVHCRRVVKPVHDHDPSKEGSRYGAVPVVAAHKTVCKADHARLLQHFRIFKFLRSAQIIEGEESSSSGLFSLEQLDHAPRGVRVFRDDILDISSQSNFDGSLVFFVRLEKIRYYADDALFRRPVLHDLLDASAEALVSLSQVDQRVKAGFLLVEPELAGAQLLVLVSQSLLHAGDG